MARTWKRRKRSSCSAIALFPASTAVCLRWLKKSKRKSFFCLVFSWSRSILPPHLLPPRGQASASASAWRVWTLAPVGLPPCHVGSQRRRKAAGWRVRKKCESMSCTSFQQWPVVSLSFLTSMACSTAGAACCCTGCVSFALHQTGPWPRSRCSVLLPCCRACTGLKPLRACCCGRIDCHRHRKPEQGPRRTPVPLMTRL